jgi:hypothetical protein
MLDSRAAVWLWALQEEERNREGEHRADAEAEHDRGGEDFE